MTETPPPPRAARLARFAPLIAIAAVLTLALIFRDRFSLEAMGAQRVALEHFVASHFVLALVIYLLLYIAIVAVSLPIGMYVTIAGGFLFGFWFGSAAAWVGSVVGAILIFLATRTAFGESLRRRAGPWLRRFESGFRENGFNYLLALRFMPFMPFWTLNLVAPFCGVTLRDFVIATAIGIAPVTLVYTSVGVALHAALAAGSALDPGEAVAELLFSPIVLGPIAGLIALSLLPVAVKAWRARRIP